MGTFEGVPVGMMVFCVTCAPRTEEEKEEILKEYRAFTRELMKLIKEHESGQQGTA
jgi:hypothetical protein